MKNNVLALLLLLVAALMNSLLTVLIELLESNGATWVQTFVYSSWINTLLLIACWIVYCFYNYYVKKEEESQNYDTFGGYLGSIFPTVGCNTESLQQWFALGARAFFGILTYACYNISILYCDAGNVILIETVITSLGNLAIGWMFFGEQMNWVIGTSLVICIVGLVLVTQPTFLFPSDSDIDSISAVGFVFIFLAGIGRSFYNAFIKKTQYLELSSMTAMLVPEMIASVLILACYLIGNLIWDLALVNEVNQNTGYTWILVSLGVMLWIWVVTATIGFRIGNMGRLGIINNTDIVMTYFLQIGILKETDGYLCYIGAGLVCIGCIIIFWEQTRREDTTDALYVRDSDDPLEYIPIKGASSTLDQINESNELSMNDSAGVTVDDTDGDLDVDVDARVAV